MNGAIITKVTPQNVMEETFFCVKDIKNPGFHCKKQWFDRQYDQGLQISILKDIKGKSIGFVEFTPASKAWRPLRANNFMFIHCMYIYSKKHKNKGFGMQLIQHVEDEARNLNMAGVCVMTSKGSWMADKRIFEKYGYTQCERKDRFELYCKKWDSAAEDPSFRKWEIQREQYQGWHLLYADQCPWHEKSVQVLKQTAEEENIKLNVRKIDSVEEAQNMPSGFGVFNLLHNGKLLEDHYLSATRFKTIVKKELAGC